MRIILLGAPGSGKGTQARFIINEYNIPQISTGDMLRSFLTSKTELNNQIKNIMNTGKLVTDELVINLVKKRINQEDCYNGFLLDGFPRNINQAEAIKKAGIMIDYILELNVPKELIVDRIIGRRIHAASGRIYHIKFNPPKIKDKDDLTGKKLVTRKDDKKETILKRLMEYYQYTVPLINYYAKEARISNTKYIKVDGTKSIDEVSSYLRKILG